MRDHKEGRNWHMDPDISRQDNFTKVYASSWSLLFCRICFLPLEYHHCYLRYALLVLMFLSDMCTRTGSSHHSRVISMVAKTHWTMVRSQGKYTYVYIHTYTHTEEDVHIDSLKLFKQPVTCTAVPKYLETHWQHSCSPVFLVTCFP